MTRRSDAFAQATVDPAATATTDITVRLRATGDARWRVEMRYPLDSENETEAFREYGEAFERGEADGALDARTFEHLADASSTVANRQMAIRNVSRSATVADDAGVLRLSFTWTAFLSTDGEHLVLRDAFRLPNDRTWLATLEPNQRLVIETPPEYTINSTNAPVVQRSGSVVIHGPRTFDAREPLTIRYEPTTGVAGYPRELVAGVGVALIVVLAMLVRRRQGAAGSALGDSGPGSPSQGAAESANEAGSDTGVSGAPPETQPEDEDVNATGIGAVVGGVSTGAGAGDTNTSAGAGTADGASGAGANAGSGSEGTGESSSARGDESATAREGTRNDLSLLSDEERVEELLEREGGRMRQAEIVEATGWSDAKVSQLLSSMVEEDRIEKLRLGRENLISLPEEDTE